LPMRKHKLDTLIEQIIWIQERNHRSYLSHRRKNLIKLSKILKQRCGVKDSELV
jgi:hypothetical protein